MCDPFRTFISLVMIFTRLNFFFSLSCVARSAIARRPSGGAISRSGAFSIRRPGPTSRLFSSASASPTASPMIDGIVTSVAGRTLPQAVDSVGGLPRIKVLRHSTSVSGLATGVDMIVIPMAKNTSSAAGSAGLVDQLPRESLPGPLVQFLSDVIKEGEFTAEVGSTLMLRVDPSLHHFKHVALVGVEPSTKAVPAANPIDPFNMGVDSGASRPLVALGRTIASLANSAKAGNVGLVATSGSGDGITSPGSVAELIVGLHEGAYADFRFRKLPKSTSSSSRVDSSRGNCKVPNSLTLIESSARPGGSSVVDIEASHGHAIASGVALARDLVGAPSNVKTPAYIAKAARQLAETLGLEVRVLGKAECEARGMGGYLSVQAGSAFEPQLIHLIYRGADESSGSGDNGADKKKPFRAALVGKGLTFDSGGYNLKVGSSSQIELMKMDMGGCAAVLGAAAALAQIRPKGVEVHFISAVCENMISAHATRPGDIVTASNGVSIEVVNTDAEGRLTLADALVYAQREALGLHVPQSGAQAPDAPASATDKAPTDLDNVAVIDLATLTGACIVGLGDKIAGLFSSSPRLRSDIQFAAQRSGESVWPLPLESQYERRVKSRIADIRNVGGSGGGGSVTAALFLKHFVAPRVPWAHLDIAGPVWSSDAKNHDGATGFGVKLLVDFILSKSKGSQK